MKAGMFLNIECAQPSVCLHTECHVLTYHKSRGPYICSITSSAFPPTPFLSFIRYTRKVEFKPHSLYKMTLTLSARYQGLIEPGYLLAMAMKCEAKVLDMSYWEQFFRGSFLSTHHLFPAKHLPSFETEGVNQIAIINPFTDFFITVIETIWVERSPLKLFRISELRAKAFSRFWLAVCWSPLQTLA